MPPHDFSGGTLFVRNGNEFYQILSITPAKVYDDFKESIRPSFLETGELIFVMDKRSEKKLRKMVRTETNKRMREIRRTRRHKENERRKKLHEDNST